MRLLIDRAWKKPAYTIGRLYIDGKFFCNTLEDTDRGLRQDMPLKEIVMSKVYGQTAIPTGTYKVQFTWSPKYNRQMPQIMSVKGYAGVRIHAGNTNADTLGCVLLGDNTSIGKLSNSRVKVAAFEELLKAAGGSAELEIR